VSHSQGIAVAFLATLHCMAALAVTAHVLLRKRDVRASIAWIGLAWLSPGLGSVLYFVFGINRVVRRATHIGRRAALHTAFSSRNHEPSDLSNLPAHIRPIARVGERTTGFHLAGSNEILILRNGDEAYPAMLDAIRGAERSIALASYIFRADTVGRQFVAALRDARARRVEIRVLVDGVGGGYLFSPIARHLRAAKIKFAPFLQYWLPWRMPFLNMRNHKKLLIVDGAHGFTGGLNLGAENVQSNCPREPIEDVHFRIAGPVVRQLMVTFAEDWYFTTGERLNGEPWWPVIPAAGDVLAHGVSSGPDEDIGVLASIMATAVSQAQQRIRIVTPYFLPDQTLNACIVLAALRGVAIDIVTPERCDHRPLDWAMRAQLALLAAPGINIWTSPAPFDHSKLMTVDGVWSLLGSANWDVRSSRLNFEFNIACYNTDLAVAIDRVIESKISRAHAVLKDELAARSLAVRLRDAAARLLLPYL
jgi:cardiolipin synthase A/B